MALSPKRSPAADSAYHDREAWGRQPLPPRPALPPPPPQISYICGLDLGQISDFSALCILEKTVEIRDGRNARLYACRHLQRWLGVSYADISEQLRPMLEKLDRPSLVVDSTGVGSAVVDILHKAKLPVRQLVPIVITGSQHGSVTRGSKGGWNVPKKELVSVAQSALQGSRLSFSPRLPDAGELKKELSVFKVKISLSANESFEAWRNSDKDDLVLACCMAVWHGEFGQQEIPKSHIFF